MQAAATTRVSDYVLSDGSEVFQSYGDLLAEAQRILGGLRSRGLLPKEKVILQLDL